MLLSSIAFSLIFLQQIIAKFGVCSTFCRIEIYTIKKFIFMPHNGAARGPHVGRTWRARGRSGGLSLVEPLYVVMLINVVALR